MVSKKKRSANRRKKNQQIVTPEKRSQSNNNNYYGTTESATASSDRSSLYRAYKASTEFFKGWGIDTWNKNHQRNSSRSGVGGGKDDDDDDVVNGVTKTSSSSSSSCSLHSIIWKLKQLAKDQIPIPVVVFQHLKRAIKYRQIVGSFYHNLPNATITDYDGHRWIIEQLKYLRSSFVVEEEEEKVSAAEVQTTPNKNQKPSSLETPSFSVLFDDDDEDETSDDDDEEEEAEASSSDGKATPNDNQTQNKNTQPSEEEIQHEERSFAIACALTEIHQTRIDLRELWKDWEKLYPVPDDNLKIEELVGISCASEYAIVKLHSTLNSTMVEFDFDFDELLYATDTTSAERKEGQPLAVNTNFADSSTRTSIQVGDSVILHKLSKNELNGQQGDVAGEMQDGRYPVRLYGAAKKYLIKPQNMIDSDDTFHCMKIVYNEFSTFDFESKEMEVADSSDPLVIADAVNNILTSGEHMASIIERKWVPAFIKLFKTFLPMLFLYSKQKSGPSDPVLRVYLREFRDTRKLTLHLAFTIVALMDSTFICKETGQSAKFVKRTLERACHGPSYQFMIDLYKKRGQKIEWFTDHRSIIELYNKLFSCIINPFPWIAGSLLKEGLRLNLVTIICVPHDSKKQFMGLIHLYWMLRVEGHLGTIYDIESGIIRVYRKNAWFKSGLPEKGKGNFVSSWQFSMGINVQGLRALKGYRLRDAGTGSHMNDTEGFHVTEISRLLYVMQWKALPASDRKKVFDEIREIARNECNTILMAPVLQCAIKLERLLELLTRGCIDDANKYLRKDDYFFRLTYKMNKLQKVCFWGLAMADDLVRIPKEEKQAGLARIAQCFELVFRDNIDSPDSETKPMLCFNPNEHVLDDSFKGERPCFSGLYAPRF